MEGGALPNIKKLIATKIASLVKKPSTRKPKTKLLAINSSKHTKPKSVTMDSEKEGAHSSTKKLTAKKIVCLVEKLSTKKPKTKSHSIQSSKCTKPKSVTKVSVNGEALPSTKKLTAKKITSLVKKPSARKPKTKSPSIQSSKHTKPKSITKVSMKGGALSSTKKIES